MKQDWEIKKLIEVCEEVFAGGDVPKGNSSKMETNAFNIPIFSNGEKNKGLYGYTNVARVTKPSITISARGTIGYSEIRKEAFYPAIRLIVVIPNTDILELSFLKHVISSIDFIHSGSSIPQLTVPMIKEYPIPLPPLPEQKRIVAILDKAFASIAKAKANAEQNLKNAKELFESYLQGVFENKGEGWEEKKLGEVCHVKGGKRLPKGHKLTSEDTGLPYIRARDLKQETVLVEQTLFLKPETQNLIKNYTVKAGDVYITIVGVNIGDVGTIPAKMAGANLTENAAKIIIKNSISNIYLVKWLTSETSRRNIIRATMAAAQGKLALTRIKDLPIFYPPPEIQDEILTKINNLSLETKKLKTIYQQKIDDLEELKKSVLQKAFNGELTEKEIAL